MAEVTRRTFLGSGFAAASVLMGGRNAPDLVGRQHQRLSLRQAVHVTGNGREIAILEEDAQSAWVRTVRRDTGEELRTTVPSTFAARSVAYLGGSVTVTGGHMHEAYSFGVRAGDYSAEQPLDAREEPGVEAWREAENSTVTRYGFRPSVMRLDSATQAFDDVPLDLPASGQVAHVATNNDALILAFERMPVPGLVDLFSLELMVLDDSGESSVLERFGRDGATAHETVDAIGHVGGDLAIVLHGSGHVRLVGVGSDGVEDLGGRLAVDDGAHVVGLAEIGGSPQVVTVGPTGGALGSVLESGQWRTAPIGHADLAVAQNAKVRIEF